MAHAPCFGIAASCCQRDDCDLVMPRPFNWLVARALESNVA